MKKFFSILAVVVLAIATVSLTSSCKKDIEKAKSLIGTSWSGLSSPNLYTIKFNSQTEFEMDVTGSGNYHYSGTFIVTGDYFTLSFIGGTPFIHSSAEGKFLYNPDRLSIENIVFNRNLL